MSEQDPVVVSPYVELMKSWPQDLLDRLAIVQSCGQSKRVGDKGQGLERTWHVVSPKTGTKSVLKKTYLGRPLGVEQQIVLM